MNSGPGRSPRNRDEDGVGRASVECRTVVGDVLGIGSGQVIPISGHGLEPQASLWLVEDS